MTGQFYPFNRKVICSAPGIDKKVKFTLFKPKELKELVVPIFLYIVHLLS